MLGFYLKNKKRTNCSGVLSSYQGALIIIKKKEIDFN